MGFGDVVRQDRRLCILRFLHESAGYTASLPLIGLVLDRDGHQVSQSAVVAELTWLESSALVKTEVLEGVLLARLTQEGLEVATGRTRVPGVRRPDPEC